MLSGFTASLLLTTVSELGDKTFFIAVILAMRHPHRLIFSAVMAALGLMTGISVLLGQALALFPKIYIHNAAIALFLIFGIKLIVDALQMPAKSDFAEEPNSEFADAKAIVNELAAVNIWAKAFVMTFLAEWGDRTQISTIALAAVHNPVAVSVGAIIGHGICTMIAVGSGYLISGKISERILTGIGGVLFLIFGITSYIQGV